MPDENAIAQASNSAVVTRSAANFARRIDAAREDALPAGAPRPDLIACITLATGHLTEALKETGERNWQVAGDHTACAGVFLSLLSEQLVSLARTHESER